jgi:hypothetical protein
MAGMDQHEQAIIVHETMNNGSADAHKKMAESHQKMMGTGTVNASRPATSFAAMNEHERLLPMNLRITVSPAPIRLWLMHTAA